jgi:Uma2 family endonuclease
MTTRAAVILDDEDLRIPAEVYAFDEFRHWSLSSDFPERGRIDYLDGEVEVELSPEDLYTHSVAKSEIAAELHALVKKTGRGNVFIDRTRIVSPIAQLSVEPDVVVVLWESLESGRVREIPGAGKGEGRYIELEGPPDVVVEVVSDSSVRKDRQRLPEFYARAGIPEFWTVDVRREPILFEIRSLGPEGYRVLPIEGEGWVASPILGGHFRLRRSVGRMGRWSYELEHRGEA